MPATRGPTATRQFRDFSGGINRTASRTAIQDNELFWLENLQPIGAGTLRSVAPPAPVLVTLGTTIQTLWGVVLTLGGTPTRLLIAVLADGSLAQVNADTAAVTTIAPAGTVSAACRLTTWQDQLVLFADRTGGYRSWDGTTLVQYPHTRTGNTTSGSPVITALNPATTGLRPSVGVSGPGIPAGSRVLTVDSATQITLDQNATATATGVTLTFGAGAPTAPVDVAAFEGRAWLVSGPRAFVASAPGSWADFSLTTGSAAASLTDSAFPGSILRALSALQTLWLFGPGAVSAVSNVRAAGTPVTTTFTQANVISGLGLGAGGWASVTPYFRSILFATRAGVYALVGATPQKISERIDRVMQAVDWTAPTPAAVAAINSIYTWLLAVRYTDPETNVTRRLLLGFANRAWTVYDPGFSVDWLTSLPNLATGEAEAWAASGASIRRLFGGAGATTSQYRTKLWDFGMFPQGKRLLRVGLEVQAASTPVNGTLTAEGETGDLGAAPVSFSNVVSWEDAATGAALAWEDAATNAPLKWEQGGLVYQTVALPTAGNWLGLRLDASGQDWTLGAIAMELEPLGEWARGVR